MSDSNPFKIFVVEDDPAYTKFLRYVLDLNPDFDVTCFSSGKECLQELYQKPDLITLDYSLPDMAGEQVLRAIKEYDPSIQVVVISAQEKIGTAVELLKLGAYDYITKDEDTKNRLLNTINNARKNISLTRQIDTLKDEITVKYDFNKSIIGESPAIQKVFKRLEKAVSTNITVSITGETGTGKELVAKAIHYSSKLKKMPWVAVNIAAIPAELMESELFGHEKGAFTGANTRRIGKFEEANGGTLFLDEIGEMDLNLQAKLLRVLQERELTRIGGNEIISLDFRLIVATHRNLAEEVEKGTFREDLYYRRLGLPVVLPPLRDRGNDIVRLAKYFIDQFSRSNDLHPPRISTEAIEKLLRYNYPGNVRELRSIIELAVVMCEDDEITDSDISFNQVGKENMMVGEEMTMRAYTFRIIQYYLDKYENNVLKVADVLDIGKSTIYRYLKEMEELNAA